MGAGQPLQQPLLGSVGAADGAPSAPPLLFGATPYAAASAPPSVGPYPPYDHSHAAGAYPPAAPPPALSPPPPPAAAQRAYPVPPVLHAPPIVHTHTTVYEGPLIQRVSLAPVLQMCPACGHTGPTRVRRERGCCTWLQCFAMTWLFCPLFWLPCCLNCSKDLVHRCGSCNAEVARISPC